MKLLIIIGTLMRSIQNLCLFKLKNDKTPYQATIPGMAPPARHWIIEFLRITIESILLAACGIILAVIIVFILHYLGYDGPQHPNMK